MNRLPVFKALGDKTRYAIYEQIASADRSVSINEIASSLGVHPNTVRPHLDRMVDVGLVEVDSGSRGTVGRPKNRYSIAATAPSLGFEPSAFRRLSGWLAEVVTRADIDPEIIDQVGQEYGRKAAASRGPKVGIEALRDELDALGFEPVSEDDGIQTEIVFSHCPFHEVAEHSAEVVCELHKGLVEGFINERGDAKMVEFAKLTERQPCHVGLVSLKKK